MKRVPLSEIKDDLSRYVQIAADEEVVVTRHGRPAAVLVGFKDEDDWFEYQLEHDPRFIARMEKARRSLEAGRGITIENARARLGLSPSSGRRAPRRKRGASRRRSR